MGDDEHRLRRDQRDDGLLDRDLALAVPCRGRFVEQHDGGVLEDGAGYGDPLALAPGQGSADLADTGVVAVRESADKRVDVGRAGGGLHRCVGRAGASHRDSGPDGVVEEIDVLEDDRVTAVDLGGREIPQITAADPDGPAIGVRVAGQAAVSRGLTGAPGCR